MNTCIRCGENNASMSRYCRRCGHRFGEMEPQPAEQYDYSPPSPYVWKTDEFQTKNEAKRTGFFGSNTNKIDQAQFAGVQQYNQSQMVVQGYFCPRCGSSAQPRIERRISTGGWITFAVLMVVVFPLFWIGLLIKENVAVCQSCNIKLQ